MLLQTVILPTCVVTIDKRWSYYEDQSQYGETHVEDIKDSKRLLLDGLMDVMANGDCISLRMNRAMMAVHIGDAAEIMLASAVDTEVMHEIPSTLR